MWCSPQTPAPDAPSFRRFSILSTKHPPHKPASLTKRHVVEAVPRAVDDREALCGEQLRVLAADAARAARAEDHAGKDLAEAQLLHDALAREARAGAALLVALAEVPHREAERRAVAAAAVGGGRGAAAAAPCAAAAAAAAAIIAATAAAATNGVVIAVVLRAA